MRLSLSVEETNALRQKIGLRLIPVHDTPAATSVPSRKQIETLASQVDAANARVEDRKLEQEATESGLITSKPATSTKSWLAEMKKRKDGVPPHASSGQDSSVHTNSSVHIKTSVHTNSSIHAGTDPDSKREGSDLAAPGTAMPEGSLSPAGPWSPDYSAAEASAVTSKSSASSRSRTAVESRAPDPLEPSTDTRSVTSNPTRQKAIFKPKKSKNVANVRKRTSGAYSSPDNRATDTDRFDAMLVRSKFARKNSYVAEAPSAEPQVFNSMSNEGVAINSMDLIRSSLEPSHGIEQGQDPRSEPKGEKEDITVDNLSEETPASTHMHGVASVLQQLRGGKGPSSQKTSSMANGRRWAKQLSKSRIARAEELKRAEAEYRNLPAKEREQAMELHKQRLLHEQATEAQELEAHYSPQIRLEHRDKHGRDLDTKDAFKELSRTFHGSRAKQ